MALMLDTKHDYRECDDDYCPLFGCRAYRDGVQAGYQRGYSEGYGVGYAEGYTAGYAAGAASGSSD